MIRSLGINDPRANMTVMAVVFAVIGVTLLLQPQRYADTPSYGNLLAIARPQVWAIAYLSIAALKALCVWRYRHGRALVIVVHTLSIMLVLAWLTAFVVRYATDSGTTIVNVASWSVYLYLLLRSALRLDEQAADRDGP